VWTGGGVFFDDNKKPIVNSDPGVRKGFENWYQIARVHPVAQTNAFVSGSAADTTINLFWSGKVVFMIATNEVPWQNDKLPPESRVRLGAAPIPYEGEANRWNFSGGFSIEISNRLKKEDRRVAQAAYDFVKWMMSDEVQREVLTETSNMPGKVSIYETLIAAETDPVKQVVIEEMRYRRAFDFVPDAPNWWGPVFTNLTDYVSGKQDLDKALAAAQDGILKLQATN